MKIHRRLFLFPMIALVSRSVLFASTAPDLRPISDAEAEAIIEARATDRKAEHEASKRALLSAEILEGRTVETSGGTLTVNRIEPPLLEKRPPARASTADQARLTPEEWAAYVESRQALVHEQISLGANVYGDEYSEITWRDPETGESFEVWTNLSLNYLSPVSSIRSGNYDYMYFGFVTAYTQEDERARLEFAASKGFEAKSRWKEPPVRFSPHRIEYFVVADDPSEVPAKLHRQLDAVLGHYVAHEEELELAHRNARTMEKARRKYLDENPPRPRETVINFWRIEE